MAFEIPIDLDYFEHPKTLRLVSLLKRPEADIYPIRLWKWAAKYARSGQLPSDPALIERGMGWKGRAGRLLQAMIDAGFINSDGVTIHDWEQYVGRSIAIYEAKKRKQREKYNSDNGIIPEESRKNSGGIPPTPDTPEAPDTPDAPDAVGGAAAPRGPSETLMVLEGGLKKAAGARISRPEPAKEPKELRDKTVKAAYELAKTLPESSADALSRYVGFLSNREGVPGSQVLEGTRSLMNWRQSVPLTLGEKVPWDRIFAYGIDEAIKRNVVNVSYVTTACQSEYTRHRDGCARG